YAECGLRILAFPCNQFGKQEPGSNEEIKEFAAGYNVKFDMFSKICVNGDDAHPLWKWMKIQPKGKGILGNAIKWNFTKFLIDKNGCVVKRYGPMEEPLLHKCVAPPEPLPTPLEPSTGTHDGLPANLLVGQTRKSSVHPAGGRSHGLLGLARRPHPWLPCGNKQTN
ncbi:glutathione peroxidase 4, partial [Homo sapiens]